MFLFACLFIYSLIKNFNYLSLSLFIYLHVLSLQVSVFGYGADSQGNWHHYWEDNKYAGAFRKTGVHSGDFERDIILKLDAEGKIKLYPKVESKAGK